jgi:hypothetical protein
MKINDNKNPLFRVLRPPAVVGKVRLFTSGNRNGGDSCVCGRPSLGSFVLYSRQSFISSTVAPDIGLDKKYHDNFLLTHQNREEK